MINLKNLFSRREQVSMLSTALLFLITFILARLGFFDIFPRFDNLAHFLGGFFLALFFIDYFKKVLTAEKRLIGDLIIIVGASLIVGVLWEIFEYVTMILGNTTAFYSGNLADTLKDLVVDMAGAGAMFFLIRHRHRKSKLFN